MTRLGTAALASLTLALGVACGGAKANRPGYDLSQFDCASRRVEYLVAGGFVSAEAGVKIECTDNKPRLTKWRLGQDNERISQTFDLSGEQFDATWEKVDSTGWRFLAKECENPGAADGDPAYKIDLGDSQDEASLLCIGKELPFPYDRLINELDLRAAGFGDDSGPAR